MADDLKQGDCLANVYCILSVNKSQRGDQSLCESHWEIDYCFMGLLLQIPVNSNISHGQQLQCRNLTNPHSPSLRAVLMVRLFSQWCQCQIQIQLMFDGHPQCNRHCARNFHIISSILTTAFILQRRKLWFIRVKHISWSSYKLVSDRASTWNTSLLMWIQCSFHSTQSLPHSI